MKFTLRIVLLLALIVAGKLTKHSTSVHETVKMLQRNKSLSSPTTSFFTRQAVLPATTVSSGRYWRDNNKPEQEVQYE